MNFRSPKTTFRSLASLVLSTLITVSVFSYPASAVGQEPAPTPPATTSAVPAETQPPAETPASSDSSSTAAAATAVAPTTPPEPSGLFERINKSLEPVDGFFGKINGYVAGFIFFPVPIPIGGGGQIPFAVLILVAGAFFFTFRMGFIKIGRAHV